ncbi:MAG: hypothetical protein ACFCUU_18970 [Cyclobacteriaceae bacterium]
MMKEDFLRGDPEYLKFERHLFIMVLKIIAGILFIAMLIEAFLERRTFIFIVDGLVMILSLAIAAYTVKYKVFNFIVAPLLILLTGFLVFLWFKTGGSAGSIQIAITALLILSLMLVRKRFRHMVIYLFVLLEASLYAIELSFPGISNNPLGDIGIRTGPVVSIIISAGIGFSIDYLKSAYEEERREIQEKNFQLQDQNNEIEVQNEELLAQQEEITRINESLEERVNERTKGLILLNKRLEEYAFINSHILRGPLSRVKGLVNILKVVYYNEQRIEEKTITYLEKSCEELDGVVYRINDALEKNKTLSRKDLDK